MLTQASSLLGPPLNGRETRRIYERGEEKGREQTWLDGLSASWWPSRLKQPLLRRRPFFEMLLLAIPFIFLLALP